MKKQAVIIGHNFNSILGIARALGPEGYEIGVIRTGRRSSRGLRSLGMAPEEKSRYVSRYFVCSSDKPEALMDLLIREFSTPQGRPVLFPVDDIAAEILDLHLNALSRHFYLPNVSETQGAVVRLMDKGYQKALARRAGLPVPEGWTVSIQGGSYALPAGISYPCFAKPETPILGRKDVMGKCADEAQLRALLDAAARKQDCLMLVEEYVDIEREYGCVGVCNRDRVCVPGITEKTLLGHGSHAGVTACGKIHLPEAYPETCEKLRAMMGSVGLQGLFDIDLYESRGVIYFNELNVRLGAEGVGTLIAGVNLARMCADAFLTPETPIDYDALPAPITFANEKPLINDYGMGVISWRDYRRFIRSADHRFLYARDDKGPYIHYSAYVLRQALKRLRRRPRSTPPTGSSRQ